MLNDFILSLFSFFVLEPVEAELNRVLAATQAPAAIVETARTCVASAGPALVDRALNDPWWATTTLVYVGVGMTSAEQAIGSVAPQCAPALRTLRPFLEGEAGA
jgi:hypothetical protein